MHTATALKIALIKEYFKLNTSFTQNNNDEHSFLQMLY